MKTLLILRHGKAENRGKELVASDHPRTLTARGAPRLPRWAAA